MHKNNKNFDVDEFVEELSSWDQEDEKEIEIISETLEDFLKRVKDKKIGKKEQK